MAVEHRPVELVGVKSVMTRITHALRTRGCGVGHLDGLAIMSQSQVATQLGLSKRQEQIAERNAIFKIRQAFKGLIN